MITAFDSTTAAVLGLSDFVTLSAGCAGTEEEPSGADGEPETVDADTLSPLPRRRTKG